jgi:hypothetical protein
MEVDLNRVPDRLNALRGEARARANEDEIVKPRVRGAPPATDPMNPAIGKWAVVALQEDADKAREAMAPLLQHREKWLWKPPGGAPGVLAFSKPATPNVERWIKRLREAAGGKPPYYLLLVGGPDRIPFEVQHALDRGFATGRLDVSEMAGGPLSWDAVRAYAEKVVRYETGGMPVDRRALLYSFATDEATQESHEVLSMPLAEHLGEQAAARLFGADATTERLCEALRKSSPAVVVTTSHGLELPADPALWGALTDSSFGTSKSPVPFSAGLARERLGAGAIVLAFACFSAGVPGVSAHRTLMEEADIPIPGAPFTSPLPRVWLGRPDGPVAFAGHVDRATSHSFRAAKRGEDADPFFHFADWLLTGKGTLGQAMSTFHERAGEAAGDLASILSVARTGAARRSPAAVIDAWVRFHDYEGYIVLGDPAIRAAV